MSRFRQDMMDARDLIFGLNGRPRVAHRSGDRAEIAVIAQRLAVAAEAAARIERARIAAEQWQRFSDANHELDRAASRAFLRASDGPDNFPDPFDRG